MLGNFQLQELQQVKTCYFPSKELKHSDFAFSCQLNRNLSGKPFPETFSGNLSGDPSCVNLYGLWDAFPKPVLEKPGLQMVRKTIGNILGKTMVILWK